MDEFSGSGNRGGFKLEPTHATIFSLELIFAISTFIQGGMACWNIRKRALLKLPPSKTTPEFDLGPLFPSFLLLTTILLTTLHLLRVVMVGMGNNLLNPNSQRFTTTSYNQAVLAMELVGETIFLATLFMLVIHRKKMTLRWRAWTEKKTFLDMGLVVIMLGLGLVRIFIIPIPSLFKNIGIPNTPQKIAIAYSAVYFTGVMNLLITSSDLYARTKEKESWNRGGDPILQHVAFPIVFLLVLDALISIVVDIIGREVITFEVVEIVVSGVTQFLMITFCLQLRTPKGSKVAELPNDMDKSFTEPTVVF